MKKIFLAVLFLLMLILISCDLTPLTEETKTYYENAGLIECHFLKLDTCSQAGVWVNIDLSHQLKNKTNWVILEIVNESLTTQISSRWRNINETTTGMESEIVTPLNSIGYKQLFITNDNIVQIYISGDNIPYKIYLYSYFNY